jgi:hypothetical protein
MVGIRFDKPWNAPAHASHKATANQTASVPLTDQDNIRGPVAASPLRAATILSPRTTAACTPRQPAIMQYQRYAGAIMSSTSLYFYTCIYMYHGQ